MGVQRLDSFAATASGSASGSAVTIGAFDGVHAGHRYLIGRLRELAAERDLASVVVTFDRHPARVVRPESAPLLLCDLDQKLELLEATGVDHVVVVPFDHTRSQEEAEHFVTDVLVDTLRARVVAVGEDFHFGRGRRGTVALLEAMGARMGFDVAHIDLLRDGSLESPVSSTAIRLMLVRGEVEAAAGALGRPYEIRGVVARGDGRGGTVLGYPTANLAVPDGVLHPAIGIYAGWCVLSPGIGSAQTTHAAAISLGVRPTFHPEEGAPVTLEAFLLDLDEAVPLYERSARVQFVSRLRDELRFESAAALAEQIARDVEATRAALARAAR